MKSKLKKLLKQPIDAKYTIGGKEVASQKFFQSVARDVRIHNGSLKPRKSKTDQDKLHAYLSALVKKIGWKSTFFYIINFQQAYQKDTAYNFDKTVNNL